MRKPRDYADVDYHGGKFGEVPHWGFLGVPRITGPLFWLMLGGACAGGIVAISSLFGVLVLGKLPFG